MRAFTFFDLALLGSANFASPCATVLTSGGGDTFDCYSVNSDVTSLPPGGTGFADNWILADGAYLHPYGDSFDSYSVGFTGTMSADEEFLVGKGTAWSGDWLTEDVRKFGDTFDTYAVAAPTAATLNDGTGFSEAWKYG